ncbi:helix-turn-helix domain-containing protein [bacterium]|nr:helix-turn-helix domain-containing protein [bacterium]
MKHITFLAVQNALGTSIMMPMEMHYIAWLIWRRSRKNEEMTDLRFDIVSRDGKNVTCFNGFPISVTGSIDDIRTTDLIIVSGVWIEIEKMLEENQRAVPWLIEHYKKGVALSSVSTGAFLLAETGLLDGKEATTYWRFVDLFKKKYPTVNLKPERMISSADNIFCSSGVNSGCDLSMYLIEKTYGTDVARQVEKTYLVDSANTNPSINISFSGQKFHTDKTILATQQWIEENYAKDFLLEEVAVRFGMSLRTFTRRFKLATGESVMVYLHRVRIEIAKEFLKKSDLNVNEIAFKVGYEDMGFFYRLFKKHTGFTPNAYRKKGQSVI